MVGSSGTRAAAQHDRQVEVESGTGQQRAYSAQIYTPPLTLTPAAFAAALAWCPQPALAPSRRDSGLAWVHSTAPRPLV